MSVSIHSNQIMMDQGNRPILHQDNDTYMLKQKMKQLESEIQSLKSIQNSARNSSRLSKQSRSSSVKVSQFKNTSIDAIPEPPKFISHNIRSVKINDLVNQMQSKNQLENIRKSSLKRQSLTLKNQSVNELKHKLQKIDSNKKKKKVVLNLMELKDAKHTVQSNIFNVTIAEIMTEEHAKYEMIKQIKDLKDKLKDLQKKKQGKQQAKRAASNLENQLQFSQFRTQDQGAGKIYNLSKNSHLKGNQIQDNEYDFEFSQENNQHSIQLKKNLNPLAWNPEISLNTKKPNNGRMKRSGRFYSTINVEIKNFDQENTKQVSKKPFLKVLKSKYIAEQLHKQNSNPQQPKKAMDLLPEMKIQKMKLNQSIPTDLISNFREYIKQKMIQIALPPLPTQHDPQSDLQSLGKLVFSLFDIYVEEQIQKKGTQYKVTKYKNCALFRLNEQKNIVWHFDGKFYFGGWEINLTGQGKKQGFGFEIIPHSMVYQGFFTNNKRQGYGIMVSHFRSDTQRNLIYEGTWKEGLKHGKGYQTEQNLQYLGDFVEGLQTGQCKIKTQTTFYEGAILESVKQGKGYETLKNGDQYCGDFMDNLFHGKGQYKWKTDAYFYGHFFQGLRQGQGTWLSKLNSTIFDSYKGEYQENKKNGFGIYQWANGTIYEGYFKNDLRHDEGLMKYINGKAAKFIWKDGNKAYKIYSQEEQTYRRQGGLKVESDQNLQIQNEQDQSNENADTIIQKNVSSHLQYLSELQKQNLFLYFKT